MINYIKYIPAIIAAIILTAGVVFFKMNCSQGNNAVQTRYDTALITRYESNVRKDTVIKWKEKITSNKSEPEIIYICKTDTVFTEKLKSYDLMLRVKKKENKLIIETVNSEDSLMKEFVFKDVYDNFTATSRHKNIFVKTSKFKWEGISALLSIRYPVSKNSKAEYETGLETGIKYKDRINVTSAISYSAGYKAIIINTNLKIKF